MPTYGYRCEKNGHEFEVFQSMTDEPLKKCTICGSPVRRIFYPVGIVFKGPGFYKTDSRGGSSATTPTAVTGDKADSSDGASEKSEKRDKGEKGDKGEKAAAKADSGGKSESKGKKSDSKSSSKKS
ncbi:MAG: hypothetical protein QOK05_815 [Chloroflexota bacterium]|jgi:putative FmdB family regulatory protein|nr:hypothetical protein [Chloroflexota bacterium]